MFPFTANILLLLFSLQKKFTQNKLKQTQIIQSECLLISQSKAHTLCKKTHKYHQSFPPNHNCFPPKYHPIPSSFSTKLCLYNNFYSHRNKGGVWYCYAAQKLLPNYFHKFHFTTLQSSLTSPLSPSLIQSLHKHQLITFITDLQIQKSWHY